MVSVSMVSMTTLTAYVTEKATIVEKSQPDVTFSISSKDKEKPFQLFKKELLRQNTITLLNFWIFLFLMSPNEAHPVEKSDST